MIARHASCLAPGRKADVSPTRPLARPKSRRGHRLLRWALASTLILWSGLATRQALSAEWPYYQLVGPFRIHADFPLDAHQALFAQLVVLRQEVIELLQLPERGERIDIYLFRDEQVYGQYMRRYFPNLQPRRAMFIKANSPGNVFAFNSSELAVDLRHESTHAILHSALPYVPLWLDEGLAEYFENVADQPTEVRGRFRSVRWATRWKRPRDLRELETLERLDQMGADEYRDAWAWVHFMLHSDPQHRRMLQQYLRDAATSPQATPLSERLREIVPELDHVFAAHFRQWPDTR